MKKILSTLVLLSLNLNYAFAQGNAAPNSSPSTNPAAVPTAVNTTDPANVAKNPGVAPQKANPNAIKTTKTLLTPEQYKEKYDKKTRKELEKSQLSPEEKAAVEERKKKMESLSPQKKEEFKNARHNFLKTQDSVTGNKPWNKLTKEEKKKIKEARKKFREETKRITGADIMDKDTPQLDK